MPIAAILKISFYHFFVNVTKYDCAKFHDKNLFLSGFRQGVTMCPSTPPPLWGMIRQKYPKADWVNRTLQVAACVFVKINGIL